MQRNMHSRQQGLTVISFISVISLILFASLIMLRVVPAYIEYFKISTALEKLSSNAKDDATNLRTPTEIRYAFQKQAEIDDIRVITSRELTINSARDGFDVGVEYETRAPIFANLSLVIQFNKSVRIERRDE